MNPELLSEFEEMLSNRVETRLMRWETRHGSSKLGRDTVPQCVGGLQMRLFWHCRASRLSWVLWGL